MRKFPLSELRKDCVLIDFLIKVSEPGSLISLRGFCNQSAYLTCNFNLISFIVHFSALLTSSLAVAKTNGHVKVVL